eukprot:gb/GECG01000455.1/.p1 GENE.gb/GECG01000455.1/~~gb/GECG01000455.1/.p1  ORF type:complete len:260 (+),score=25.78 gb/GECG01000455.1/:1-780(+)
MKRGHRTSSSRSQPGNDATSRSRTSRSSAPTGLQSLDEKLLQVGKKFPEVYFEDDTPPRKYTGRPNTVSATRRSTDDGGMARAKSSGRRYSPSRSRSGSNITSSSTTASSRGAGEGGLRILRSKSGRHSNTSTSSTPTKASSPKRPSTASSLRHRSSNKEGARYKQRAATAVDIGSTSPLCSVIPEDELKRFEKRAANLSEKFEHDKELFASHDKGVSKQRSSKRTATIQRTPGNRDELIAADSSYLFTSKDFTTLGDI